MRTIIGALAFVALSVSATLRADQTSAITAAPVLSTRATASGQPISVPTHPEVIVTRLQIAPDSPLPFHEHPYPRYAYVLSGGLEISDPGGKTRTFKAGDFIVEVIGECHRGRAINDAPVQLLVIDQVAPGQSNTVACTEKPGGTATHR